jgi:uncharacterized membrane protein
MQQARESLSDKWVLAIIGFLIFGIITGVGGPIGLIISGPMLVGAAIFSLSLSRNKKNLNLAQFFEGFKKFEKSLIAYLLIVLYTVLWSLLFIIPGIIAAISYSQTFYILADDAKISGQEAIHKSKKMMSDKKWKYFCLSLRFTGWFILSILTFGIGFLWLYPYMQISFAKFYEDIKP